MSAEADAIIKAACIQAAAVAWLNTDMNQGSNRNAQHVAERTAEYAAMLFAACKKKLVSEA